MISGDNWGGHSGDQYLYVWTFVCELWRGLVEVFGVERDYVCRQSNARYDSLIISDC